MINDSQQFYKHVLAPILKSPEIEQNINPYYLLYLSKFSRPIALLGESGVFYRVAATLLYMGRLTTDPVGI